MLTVARRSGLILPDTEMIHKYKQADPDYRDGLKFLSEFTVEKRNMTMKIERFEDIEAWQLGRKLTNRVYALTGDEPFSRDYALRVQIRRASGSIMHDIAEGFDSGRNLEFARFLGYAKPSCTEVQSQLYIALDQAYVSQEVFSALYEMAGTTRGKIQVVRLVGRICG